LSGTQLQTPDSSLEEAGGAKNCSFVPGVANNGKGTSLTPKLQQEQRITQCNSFEHRWWVNYMGGEPCRGIFCTSFHPFPLPKLSFHVGILNSIVCASWWVGINDKVFSVTHMTVGIPTPHSCGMSDIACYMKF